VNNVFALHRLEKDDEVVIVNVSKDNFSFAKLVSQRKELALNLY